MNFLKSLFPENNRQVCSDKLYVKYDQDERTCKLFDARIISKEYGMPAVVENSLINSISNKALKSKTNEILKLPFGITTLGSEVFSGCENLKEVHLSESISYLHADALLNLKKYNTKVIVYQNSTSIEIIKSLGLEFSTKQHRLFHYLNELPFIELGYLDGKLKRFVKVKFSQEPYDNFLVLESDLTKTSHFELIQLYRLVSNKQVIKVSVDNCIDMKLNNASIKSVIYSNIAKVKYGLN